MAYQSQSQVIETKKSISSTSCVAFATSPASSEDGNELGDDGTGTVERILDIFRELSALPSLVPSPHVNNLFTSLVTTCLLPLSHRQASSILSDPRIAHVTPRLRALCSTGEGELETYWASSILASLSKSPTKTDAWTLLSKFPYYKNYTQITTHETNLILSTTLSSPQHILFIGSGPLPLTSFLLATHFPRTTFNNIDTSLPALALSKSLARNLGLASRMGFTHADASSLPRAILEGADVVYLAALVGLSAVAKGDILRKVVVGMREGAVLVVRSAWGLRGLLYPVIEVESLDLAGLGLVFLREWRPDDDGVVNSVLLFRVRRNES